MGHTRFMLEAIRLSRVHMMKGAGGPFGAVIVKNKKIIGRGWNQVTSKMDPTAHAEVMAIREACRNLGSFELIGATIYTSCEPCPMCLSAIYWARIERIYYANTRKDAAKINFDDDFLYKEIAKPISRRKMPMKQVLRRTAGKIFKLWAKKEDRVIY